jgi:ATP-dependent Zn protease
MVGSFGMAGSLASFEAIESGFMSQGIVAKVMGDKEGRRAVETILENAKGEVRALLDDHRYLVEALRDALLEREELVGDEIVDVLHEAQQRARLFG